MNKTKIEWTDYTWNPVTGCNKISQGCKHCYAETMAKRFWGDRKFTDVQMHEDRLDEPVKNKKKWKGKKVFVCSMSDLFHEKVSDYFILSVFEIIQQRPETIFQIVTKRIDRAVEWFRITQSISFPLPNVWFIVSVEDQHNADLRIPLLLQIPAVVRGLSCEPLIGPIDLEFALNAKLIGRITWVIVGGESGHGARPMHPDWVRSLRNQCSAAGVPFFFKQWGQWVDPIHLSTESTVGPIKFFYIGKNPKHGEPFIKLGKSKSGNLLDGKQHLNFPLLKHKNKL